MKIKKGDKIPRELPEIGGMFLSYQKLRQKNVLFYRVADWFLQSKVN